MPIPLLTRAQVNRFAVEWSKDQDVCFAIFNGDDLTWSPIISHIENGVPQMMTAPEERFPTEARAIGAALDWAELPRVDYPDRRVSREDLRLW